MLITRCLLVLAGIGTASLMAQVELASGTGVSPSIDAKYACASVRCLVWGPSYRITVPDGATRMSVVMDEATGLGMTLYGRYGAFPALAGGSVVSDFSTSGIVTLSRDYPTPAIKLRSGTYYFQTAVTFRGTTQVKAAARLTVTLESPLGFIPITPCRIADTREGYGKSGPFGPPLLNGSRDLPVTTSACGIPAGAGAYSLNVTAVPRGRLGYVTVWPQGRSQPPSSNLNAPSGNVTANAVIVPAGSGGGISVYASDPTDLVVDINGYFIRPDTVGALAFYPLSPCRVMDTRPGSGPEGPLGPPPFSAASRLRVVPVLSSRCAIPPNAVAYSLNLTVVPNGSLGYMSVWPAGRAQPTASTLNSSDGAVLANSVLVPAGDAGAINIYAEVSGTATVDAILDINGYFAAPGPGGLSLYPSMPCRVADTRQAPGLNGAFGPPSMFNGEIRTFPMRLSDCAIPFTAQAYALNVTVVPTGELGYLSIYPTGSAPPGVSTLNSWNGRILANSAIVPAGINGSVNVFTSLPTGATTDVVLDLFGYFAP